MLDTQPILHCWRLLPAPLRQRWLWLGPLGALTAALDLIVGVSLLRLGEHLADSGSPTRTGFAILMAAVTLKAALRLAESAHRERCAEATVAEFGRRLLRHWLQAPMRLHLLTPPTQRVDDVQAMANLVGREGIQSLVLLATESLVVVALLGLLFAVSPLPAFIVLLACGALAFASLRLSHRRHEHWSAALGPARVRLQAFVQGCLQGFREIRLGGRADFFARRFVEQRAAFGRTLVAIDTWRQIPLVLNEALFLAGALALVFFAGEADGSSTTLLLLFLYTGLRLLPAVNRLVFRTIALRVALPAARRIAPLLAHEPGPTTPSDRPAPRELLLAEVSFTYPGREIPAVTRATLTVQAGRHLALVGPSGGGKSTLLLLLSGLLPPDRGTASADGLAISADDAAWRKHVGYVGQEPFLIAGTLRANIALGEESPDSARLNRATALAQLDDLTAGLPQGLDTPVGEGGHTLSGGQRQRVALARELYRGPSLLLLDEATAFVDQAQEQRILAALTHPASGLTLVLVTHRLAAARCASQVAFVRQGTIEACAPFDELAATHAGFQSFLTAGERPGP